MNHQYLVIGADMSIFNTPYLIFPNWISNSGTTLMIICLATCRYITCNDWQQEFELPNWKRIPEDHL